MAKPYKSIDERNKAENRLPEHKMSAAQFKRKFTSKAAIARAESAVDVRTNLGTMKNVSKDKARLRSTWDNRGENPGSFHKPWSSAEQDRSVFKASKLSAHIRSSL